MGKITEFTNYKGEKQKINFDYAFSASEGSSIPTNDKYIIAHSTATPNATAKNEAQYFKKNWASSETYVQFCVDDTGAYGIGEEGYLAWGAGATGNKNSPVQIELCEFNNRTKALNAYKNFVNLLRASAKAYGLNYVLGQGIVTHHQLAQWNHETNHTDPDTYLASLGISERQFAQDLLKGFGGSTAGQSGASLGKPAESTSTKKFKVSIGLGKYKTPDFSNQIGTLKVGDIVSYETKLVGKSYTWLKLSDGSYIPAVQNARNYGVFI